MQIIKDQNQKGGALIVNILVGVGIFAVLSLLALPNIRKYQSNLKLNGVAKDLVADLRYAQQLTITEQTVYLVEFSTSTVSYAVIKTGAASSTIKTVDFPADISYDSVSANLESRVVFNSFGGVSQSGAVVLKNSDDSLTTINIKPSGYIQLVQ